MTLLLALACQRERPEPPPGEPYAVTYDGERITLLREGEALLRLPLVGVVHGAVASYDPNKSYDPYFPEFLGASWHRATGASGTWPVLDLRFDGGHTAKLVFREDDEGRYAFQLLPVSGDEQVALVRLQAEIDPDEGLYGLGSALDHVNRRGSIRAAQLEADPTTEAFSNEMHVHVTFALGTTGWGWLVRDDHPMTFDLGAQAPDQLEITVGLGPDAPDGLVFEWYAADHPLDLTARYWQSTGLHRLPARWALGPLHWRDENEDQAEVEQDLRTLRELDLATSAVWIDRPYATGVNTFDFEAARFPDPQGMIELAHELGFRMALWHTPYVAPDEAGELYDTALSEGYYPPVRPPAFIDWGNPIDFTNPEAYAWWQGLIDRYTEMGIEGYKLDYAEEVLVGAIGGRLPWEFWDGSDELTMHAHYQRLYHQVYAETLPAEGGFLLNRTAAWGDQVTGPVIWPGDLDATMDPWGADAVDRDGEPYVAVGGLPASLVDALSLGPSGFPFYGSDTGGYRHSPPDNETFVRWYQQTALSTVMQVGNSTNDVAWEPTPENGFDAATLDGYRVFARLHLRLWPYLWTEAQRIGEGVGRPIMRPLGLAHPELGLHPDDVYLLGDHLLVAPVVERGAREKQVHFPPGRWIDWFRGTVHAEGTETVAAELHDLPLFLAQGGIVALLRPTIDTLSPTTVPDEVDSYATTPGILWPRLFPGAAGEVELFDGTRIAQRVDGDEVVVEWTDGGEFRDGAVVEAIGTARPTAVELDGVALTEQPDLAAVEVSGGWTWTDEVGGTLFVRVPAGSAEARWR